MMERMKRSAGTIFGFFFTGANYDRVSRLLGLGRSFYRSIALLIPTRPSDSILEPGCGTASLTLAIADRHSGKGRYHVTDFSTRNLAFAAQKARKARIAVDTRCCSMGTLPFESASMDVVAAGLSFHRASPGLRRKVIHEAARVLKPKGVFALVDWSKPRFGLRAMIFFPLLMFKTSGDHWNNSYPMLCRNEHLLQITDTYINSLIRCQIFRKV